MGKGCSMKCPHCGKGITKPLSVMDLKDIQVAAQRVADRIRNEHFFDVAGGGHWASPAALKEYREYKKKIRQINDRIANMEI